MLKRENLAVQIHTHGFPEVTEDTLNRVKKYLTDKTVIVCDQMGWKDILKIKTNKLCGVYHGNINSPYRNQIIGLSHLFKKYPHCTWYGNVEWDTAINGTGLLEDLSFAEGCWTAGFDMREYDHDWKVLSSKLNRKITKTLYFIGCCLFFHHDFIEICEKEGYFAKILEMAKIYGSRFPDYREWSVDEALLPSLSRSYDKQGYEFGCWEDNINRDRYSIRYKPGWDELPEMWHAAHPLKDMRLRQ